MRKGEASRVGWGEGGGAVTGWGRGRETTQPCGSGDTAKRPSARAARPYTPSCHHRPSEGRCCITGPSGRWPGDWWELSRRKVSWTRYKLDPWTHCVSLKLQALVYDILPSTIAVFSYAMGPRKLSSNEQFFCGCSNSSKFVTNNSDYVKRLFYN